MKAKFLAVAVLGLVFLCGCWRKHHPPVQQAPAFTNDVQRFQMFYAPFPDNNDSVAIGQNGNSFATRVSRLFLIDTKLGKVWVYNAEMSSSGTNHSGVDQYEGFTPIAVLDDPMKLFRAPNTYPKP